MVGRRPSPSMKNGKATGTYRGQDGYSVLCPIERKRIASLFELYEKLERTTLSWERADILKEIETVKAIKTNEP